MKAKVALKMMSQDQDEDKNRLKLISVFAESNYIMYYE
jgi:hypothetical protein